MLTLVADSNIAHLSDYFNQERLGVPVNVIDMAGRDINAAVINEHQPDALLVRSVTKINPALLNQNNSVQFVGSATIGIDHISQGYLSMRGIRVVNAAGSSKHSVAQYVLTALLTLRPQYWHKPAKLGIIGLGNIGSVLAQYALDLGWEVLGYDPFLADSVVNNSSFEAVLSQSDVVSLHVPLTTSEQSERPTYHLIDKEALALMPSDTMLINTARGAVVSEADLLDDLASHHRQVVLDVFEHEPTVSADLLDKLALATPHIAGYTLEGKLRGTQMIYDKVLAIFGDDTKVNTPQSIDNLLPENPYHWAQLSANPDRLAEFYDIKADDAQLRQAVDTQAKQVNGDDFDALRKNYQLRREWLI